jgi:hypothetical protein
MIAVAPNSMIVATLHVFKEKRLRRDLSNRANRLWEHVALVVLPQVLST